MKRDNKPKKQPFYDRKKLLMEIIPLMILLSMFGIAIYVHPMLPDNIPTHWNAAGEPDNYSGKDSVFMIPIFFLVISILLFVLPLMEVFRDNMLKIYRYYYTFKILFGMFFIVLFISTILTNFGKDLNIAYVVIVMISLLFIGLGLILPKLKRNFMFGIRTGWTLSSDTVWEKTHKLGGLLFIIVGILTIIILFLLTLEIMFFVFIGLVLLISLFLVFYSYYIYKNEQGTRKR